MQAKIPNIAERRKHHEILNWDPSRTQIVKIFIVKDGFPGDVT